MQLNYNCLDILSDSKLLWVQYNMEVLNRGLSDRAKELKKLLVADSKIQVMLKESLKWPEMVLKRHNDAKHIIHKICLLLDFGMTYDDDAMKKIADKILLNQSEDGAFLTLLNISKNFGGSGEEHMDWIMCDFPILLYILIKLGLGQDERVVKATNLLISMSSDNGWRCKGSLPKFRGPGRKADHCPYGTLMSLKAFSLLPQHHKSDFIEAGIDAILNHWRNQKERKIYMFGIGTDFRKLKYPNIWFDIVGVLRVLSHYDYAKASNEYKEMLDIVKKKQTKTGGFIPESIYMAWKGWDFGQKKAESDSLTYQIYRIFENS